MRHKNGNCLPVGGFCTAVDDIYCQIAKNAYADGLIDGVRLEQMATDDSEPVRHGHWKHVGADGSDNNVWMCSACGKEFELDAPKSEYEMNYCPNCGARMDEVNE